MDCSAVQEQLEAYAVGALEREELTAIDDHLADCPACQSRLREYQELVALLPEALAVVSPARLPGELKIRLVQKIESDMVPSSPVADRIQAPRQHAGPSTPQRPAGWWRVLEALGVPQLRWAALAVGVLLAAAVAWGILLNVALARERSLRAEFAGLVDQQELVLEVVDSNKTDKQLLRPPGSGSTAYGKLYTRSDMAYVVAMAARLTPPPPGLVYQLWLFQPGSTILAGTMNVNEEGFGLIVYESNQTGPVYEKAELILQPPGSPAPVGDPSLIWPAPK